MEVVLSDAESLLSALATQVMKYGKNQWARISSLLVRKSAKQCKARWHEWLDPSIKKTEWTREEDERLLHLAKLMPTQWRTIAPIVGRTPAQCLERYEKLLDAAVAKEGGAEPSADDPRRLRPGEIDPNPESKPARPDAVDMEEDEKEMLSEARARLANTRGKKAKRKAREKQLEEARRLAALQKRRELKAAGIVSRGGGRRIMGIDYNNEIAFEKKAPAGFYDTSAEKSAEQAAAEKPFKPVTLAELEGTRRRDIEEALMKRDAKRQKINERHDAPSALAAQLAAAQAEGGRKRSKLMMPAPQVSERELEEIARLGPRAAGVLLPDDELGGSDATRALLADYSTTPSVGATPLRTPRVPATGGGGDFILQEAQNLARLQSGQTPLVGGENPMLHPSDFSGITPRRKDAATPHPLAMAGATPLSGGPAATPRMPGVRGMSAVAATPVRDALNINDPDALLSASAREERARVALLRCDLVKGLSSLPVPRNEYQIVVPEMADMDMETEGGQAAMEEDAADVEWRLREQAAAEAQLKLRKRSHAVQRNLPIPVPAGGSLTQRAGDDAAALLNAELALLVAHDAAKYPTNAAAVGAKRDRHAADDAPVLEDFSLEALEEAGALIREEASALRLQLGHESLDMDIHLAALQSCRDAARIPLTVEQLRKAFAGVRSDMEQDAKRAAKLDGKAALLFAGYQRRATELQTTLEDLVLQTAARRAELQAFQLLHTRELRAAPARIEAVAEEVGVQAMRERSLQQRYAAVRHELTKATM
jgi:pre-mRNA-splicing factor CDC5/CEF1